MAENKNAQQVREITDKLEQGIKELFESERFKEYLRTMSKFYNYSFNNTLLIAMQKPEATYVAGYTSWQRNFDRQVMKGEKGIKILAPAPYKAQEEHEKIDPLTQKPVIGADGKAVTETVEVELYGKDAKKAAPLLGTKLLEKKVRGKPSVPVTGFRESAWVAGSHKLWKSGVDVFLSKDGETFKELKAADYIPVGATLNVDGIKCRIEAVDFAADEVRLTNIEDKNRPIRFSESIQYVRSYVEDAGTAIYDTIPKKPTARESIRDKLKSAQKGQPPHTPKPQKSKGKDMEL